MSARKAEQRRDQAAAAIATMIGAITIARATNDADLARTVLDAAQEAVLRDGGRRLTRSE
jgi:TetR/AcrR family transcriptional repressor of nem operon